MSSSEAPQARPTRRALLDAASVELTAFEQVGRKQLGLDTWHAARVAAEQARRDCWAGLRAHYGPRNPHWGVTSFVLLAAGLFAPVAAVLASGLRHNPADTAITAMLFAVVSALGALAVMVASRGRPLNRGFLRPFLLVAVGLGLAAAFQLSQGAVTAPVVTGAAVIGIGTFIGFFLFRARDPEGTEEMDTAINRAFALMQPTVDEIEARMRAEVTSQLSAQEQERIVESRGAAPAGSGLTESTPAGGVIISVMLGTWIPDVMRDA